ncbi:hypothetical protein WJX84_006489 [Apatococcus fuscideae]
MSYEDLQALGESVGVVSRGVAEQVIRALPRACFGHSIGNASTPESCPVCQMEHECGDEVLVLPCNHFYHPGCITQWLLINKACPICSHEVLPPSLKIEGTPSAQGQRCSTARRNLSFRS